MSARRSPLAVLACALCALFAIVPSAGAIDNGTIVFQGNRGGSELIFTMAPNGSGLKQWGAGTKPVISRDGKTIVFTKTLGATTNVWARNSDGGNLRQITTMSEDALEPSVSANGKRIAFVAPGLGNGGEARRVFTVDSDGTDLEQVTQGSGFFDGEPAISPDGKRITFVRADGGSKLIAIDADGKNLKVVTGGNNAFSRPEAPSYSPNGKRIVFDAATRGGNAIFACDADDCDNRDQVTKDEPPSGEPSYSPDGNLIVFSRAANIFTVKLDGTGLDKLGDLKPGSGAANLHPSWGR